MAGRRCIALRGDAAETRREALARLGALSPADVLWASPSVEDVAPFACIDRRALAGQLGRSVDAVVLDLHDGIDADAIARAEGLVRGGGALILRCGAPASRFSRRFHAMLPRHAPEGLGAVPHARRATAEQDALVTELAARFVVSSPSVILIVADRGRGKSAGLGRALRAARDAQPSLEVAVTGAHEDASAEMLRFAGPGFAYVAPSALTRATRADVIVVDEAAQLPIPLLRQIVLAHPRARIALATTCRGYEGTGRGFSLRFAAWLRDRGRPPIERTLRAPIRWDEGDALERWVYDALLLDAEPAVLAAQARLPARHRVLDRDALADDERTLRQVFGLLVEAHYRTTPGDLVRMLDAPELSVHALFEGDDVVAASVVGREGGLDAQDAEAMITGARRITGHALADTLVTHAGHVEAAAMTMIRSVRIVVHPERRGLGLARQLVEAVHTHEAPDLFGTIFGATPSLIAFRRALGYELVRVGLSRGARSGEPAAVMVRPVSARARTLLASLRTELAREIDVQLALRAADDAMPLDPALASALRAGLPEAAPLALDALRARLLAYTRGAQPVDAVAGSLADLVRRAPSALAHLAPSHRALIEARIVRAEPWDAVAAAAGLPSAASAMRAMRDAVRALLAD